MATPAPAQILGLQRVYSAWFNASGNKGLAPRRALARLASLRSAASARALWHIGAAQAQLEALHTCAPPSGFPLE